MSETFGRSLVLDMNGLNDQNLVKIGETLSELLLLLTKSVSNNQSVTHLSLHLVDIQTKQLIPLSVVKSKQFSDNCLKIVSKLTAFRSKQKTTRNDFSVNFGQNIEFVFKEIEESVKRLKTMSYFQITYISGRGLDQLLSDLCHVLTERHINTSFLTMLNIVSIESRGEPVFRPVISVPSGAVQQQQGFKIPESLEALIESQTIEDTYQSIDGYFKGWLQHLNVVSEKIRIYLNSGHNSEEFVIRCDLKEAVIDLNYISIDRMDRQLEANQSQTITSLTNIREFNGCYDLHIIASVGREGLCDSIIYGIPYVLSATRCPTLSYNELNLNSNRFSALIEVMNEKKAVLILESKQPNSDNSSPKGLFALLSSLDTKTLLLKCIASKELLLPYFNDSIDELIVRKAAKPVVDSVRQHLNQMPFYDVFNPLYVSNNLFDFLSKN